MTILPCVLDGCACSIDNWLDPQSKRVRYFIRGYGCGLQGPLHDTEQAALDQWNDYPRQVRENLAHIQGDMAVPPTAFIPAGQSADSVIGASGEKAGD